MTVVDGLSKKHPHKRTHHLEKQAPPEDFYYPPEGKSPHRSLNFTRFLYFTLLFILVSLATVFGIVSTLDYKSQLEKSSQDVESEIKDGLVAYNAEDLDAASGHFVKADSKLTRLKINLQEGGQYIPYFFYLPQSDSKLNDASKILKATGSLTRAITLASHLFQSVGQKSAESDQVKLISEMTGRLTSVAQDDLESIQLANQDLKESEDILKATKSGQYSDLIGQIQDKIPEIKSTLNEIFRIYQLLPGIFAKNNNEEKKYLILFQNNSELRPAGGFLGSFAVADFQRGELKALDFQTNIYKLDQPFIAKNPIPSPAEYQYLNANMALKDSNYQYDFPTSMATVLDYYNKETGQTADGVIALDTTLITELLKIVGPIEMPEYKMSVTADNFLSEIEYQVEIGYFQDKSNWSENAPKKILAELMPRLIAKTFSGLNQTDKRKKIMDLLTSSLSGKHLLFYAQDQNLQDYLVAKNYSGSVKQVESDYFFLSNSNIGGMKSSLNVHETVNQKVNIDSNGLVKRSVDIVRKHTGSSVWPDGENKTFNKVIVPKGSVLNNYRIVSGSDLPYGDWANRDKAKVDTSDENGKTIFSFWLNTKPGETSEMVLEYQLPVSLSSTDKYQLLVQKQPGTLASNYSIDIKADRKSVLLNDKQITTPIAFNLLEDMVIKTSLK